MTGMPGYLKERYPWVKQWATYHSVGSRCQVYTAQTGSVYMAKSLPDSEFLCRSELEMAVVVGALIGELAMAMKVHLRASGKL